jgi:hypothetical protein
MISLFRTIASLFGGIFPILSILENSNGEDSKLNNDEENKGKDSKLNNIRKIHQIEFGNQYSIYEEMELIRQLSYTIQMREY